ncbi:TetR/AcrR family transcriptional regulator [Sandaracinobacteroides hominis]|uniref:TetR/AcrR family transcriptional regulator n=1 Tax=Sandaracinobacteroides hominis TaxID=2780086 RepID=UPI0018F39BE4|nr:TetR/AcrR family transcriptional regulator [Sandaracinobacteroides hominis]
MIAKAARSRGKPSNQVSGQSAAAIKRAALDLFAIRGFDGASTREIAAAAGVDASLISYQFGSKLGLWKAIVADVGRALMSALDGTSAGAEASARDQLQASMTAFVDFALRNPALVQFLRRDAETDVEHSRYLGETLGPPIFDRHLPLMEAAKAAGGLPEICPAIAVLHFSQGVAAMVRRRELLVSRDPRLADDEIFRAALCDTLIAPLFRND